MATSTITSKGQVTIPRSIPERLNWKAGDRLDFTVDASGRIIVELATDVPATAAGSGGPAAAE